MPKIWLRCLIYACDIYEISLSYACVQLQNKKLKNQNIGIAECCGGAQAQHTLLQEGDSVLKVFIL